MFGDNDHTIEHTGDTITHSIHGSVSARFCAATPSMNIVPLEMVMRVKSTAPAGGGKWRGPARRGVGRLRSALDAQGLVVPASLAGGGGRQ